jgi:hypothetical protein
MSSREIKNQLCIDGSLNATFDAMMRSTSPDEMFALLTELAHKAVDAAWDAPQARIDAPQARIDAPQARIDAPQARIDAPHSN